MIGQLAYITLSIILFGLIFFQMIRKNDTGYVLILLLEAIGIIIDGIGLIFKVELFNGVKFAIYALSIFLPIIILILTYLKIDFINLFKFAKVKFYIARKDYKKAKDILIAIVEKDDKNYQAHKYLAFIYEQEGGVRKAIDEYVKCIELNKKDYESYYKVSMLLQELDKKDEAIEMLKSLVEKQPDNHQATIALSDLLIEKASYKEAVGILTEALMLDPMNFEINYELGIAYTMLNDFQNAKECYEKAAEINSMNYNVKYNLAQISMLYKDIDSAEEYFSQSLEDEDLEADSYFELAKIKLMRGDKETAIKYANMAVDIDSKRISAKIKKEPLFIMIMTKISIPFNLEEKEIVSLTEKDNLAKEHLENTSDITINMGYKNVANLETKDLELEVEKDGK